jgi:hypothetical protein
MANIIESNINIDQYFNKIWQDMMKNIDNYVYDNFYYGDNNNCKKSLKIIYELLNKDDLKKEFNKLKNIKNFLPQINNESNKILNRIYNIINNIDQYFNKIWQDKVKIKVRMCLNSIYDMIYNFIKISVDFNELFNIDKLYVYGSVYNSTITYNNNEIILFGEAHYANRINIPRNCIYQYKLFENIIKNHINNKKTLYILFENSLEYSNLDYQLQLYNVFLYDSTNWFYYFNICKNALMFSGSHLDKLNKKLEENKNLYISNINFNDYNNIKIHYCDFRRIYKDFIIGIDTSKWDLRSFVLLYKYDKIDEIYLLDEISISFVDHLSDPIKYYKDIYYNEDNKEKEEYIHDWINEHENYLTKKEKQIINLLKDDFENNSEEHKDEINRLINEFDIELYDILIKVFKFENNPFIFGNYKSLIDKYNFVFDKDGNSIYFNLYKEIKDKINDNEMFDNIINLIDIKILERYRDTYELLDAYRHISPIYDHLFILKYLYLDIVEHKDSNFTLLFHGGFNHSKTYNNYIQAYCEMKKYNKLINPKENSDSNFNFIMPNFVKLPSLLEKYLDKYRYFNSYSINIFNPSYNNAIFCNLQQLEERINLEFLKSCKFKPEIKKSGGLQEQILIKKTELSTLDKLQGIETKLSHPFFNKTDNEILEDALEKLDYLNNLDNRNKWNPFEDEFGEVQLFGGYLNIVNSVILILILIIILIFYLSLLIYKRKYNQNNIE